MLCIILGSSFLVGCGSNSKAYEAYQEFYQEFYDEHIDKGSEYTDSDCGAQVVFDEKNNPLLVICDIYESVELYGWRTLYTVDIYVYEYSGGKVKEKVRKTYLKTTGLSIYNVDGKIIMHSSEIVGDDNIDINDGYEIENLVYPLEETGFTNSISLSSLNEDVKEYIGQLRKEDKKANDEYIQEFVDSKYPEGVYSYYELLGGWQASTSAYSSLFRMNGSDFETLLSKLVETNPETVLDLKIAYSEYFVESGIENKPYFEYIENGRAYVYSGTDKKFFYLGKQYSEIEEEKLEEIPKQINGVEVELSNIFISEFLRTTNIKDFTKLEYSNDRILIETNQGLAVDLDTLIDYDTEYHENSYYSPIEVRYDYYYNKYNIDGKYSYGDTITAPVEWFISAGDKYIESSYEEIKKYIDAGLATGIYFEMDNKTSGELAPYEMASCVRSVSVGVEDMDSYYSLMSEQEKKDYIALSGYLPAYEEYIEQIISKEDYANQYQIDYSFAYIDEDNIPELLVIRDDGGGAGSGVSLLSYKNNEVQATWISQLLGEFNYTPRENRVIYTYSRRVIKAGESAHLDDGLYVVDKSCYDNTGNLPLEEEWYSVEGYGYAYYVNDEGSSSTEYNNFINKYLQTDNMMTFTKTYSSIEEAYNNIDGNLKNSEKQALKADYDININDDTSGNKGSSINTNYLIPDSDTKYLTDADISHLSKDELRFARNEIYARHGRRFKSSDLQSYFDSQSWYSGTINADDFSEASLNKYEKANIQFILNAEKK